MLNFIAFGVAQSKGSTKAFIPKGWTRPIVTSDNPKNKGWQQLVAEAASAAIEKATDFRVITGPALLTVVFYLPRPKAIKDRDVPHLKKPDLDKLCRSCKDALTKVVFHDDSQVVEIRARKLYARPGEVPRAEISVSEVEHTATLFSDHRRTADEETKEDDIREESDGNTRSRVADA